MASTPYGDTNMQSGSSNINAGSGHKQSRQVIELDEDKRKDREIAEHADEMKGISDAIDQLVERKGRKHRELCDAICEHYPEVKQGVWRIEVNQRKITKVRNDEES